MRPRESTERQQKDAQIRTITGSGERDTPLLQLSPSRLLVALGTDKEKKTAVQVSGFRVYLLVVVWAIAYRKPSRIYMDWDPFLHSLPASIKLFKRLVLKDIDV